MTLIVPFRARLLVVDTVTHNKCFTFVASLSGRVQSLTVPQKYYVVLYCCRARYETTFVCFKVQHEGETKDLPWIQLLLVDVLSASKVDLVLMPSCSVPPLHVPWCDHGHQCCWYFKIGAPANQSAL